MSSQMREQPRGWPAIPIVGSVPISVKNARSVPLHTVRRVINGGEATEFYLNRKTATFIRTSRQTEGNRS